MSSTSTTRLGLFKPVSGSGEPFRTSDLNSNWDKVDAEAVAADSRLDVVELAVGSSGTVANATLAATATLATTATKATNVAGGTMKRIPIQSAADTTVFVAAPSAVGQNLVSSPVAPYAGWSDPVPYKVQTGIITSGQWASGQVTVTFTTSFDSGIVPIVSLTPIAANTSSLTNVSFNAAPSATGFVANARTYNGSTFANGSPTTYWIAIQYSSGSGSS